MKRNNMVLEFATSDVREDLQMHSRARAQDDSKLLSNYLKRVSLADPNARAASLLKTLKVPPKATEEHGEADASPASEARSLPRVASAPGMSRSGRRYFASYSSETSHRGQHGVARRHGSATSSPAVNAATRLSSQSA